MKIEDLEKFGITKTEAKILLELIKLRSSKIGEIIKRTSLHRGTVYNSLDKLISKSFVKFTKDEDGTVYRPSDSDIFLDLINLEKDRLKKKENIAKNLTKEISRIIGSSKTNKNIISIGLGKRAYMHHYWEMFRICKEKKLEYCWIGEGTGNTSKQIGEHNYRKILNMKKQLGIKCRSIMNIKAKPMKDKDYSPGARYVSEDYHFPTYIWIYGNRVVIVIWTSQPMIIITMEDEATAKSYQSYFEFLWKTIENKQKEVRNRHLINIYKFLQKANESIDFMGLNLLIPLHEGREKIIELLKKGKRVRVLIANSKSKNFEKRVIIEEKYIKDIHESRILYELKSVIANLKDIKARLKNKCNLEIHSYSGEPKSIIILDDKKIMYNKYKKEKGVYGASKETIMLDKGIDEEFDSVKKIFEEYWKDSKELKI